MKFIIFFISLLSIFAACFSGIAEAQSIVFTSDRDGGGEIAS